MRLPIYQFIFTWSAMSALFLAADATKPHRTRDKRSILILNPASRLVVGLQIIVPLSVVFPNLALFNGRQSRTFGQDSSYYDNLYFARYQKPNNALSMCDYMSRRLEDYFHLLGIYNDVCQERFICELASEPEKFRPLSDIMLSQLSQFRKYNFQNTTSIMSRQLFYAIAAHNGAESDKPCKVIYSSCPEQASQMMDMTLLQAWQLITSFVDIKYTGETDLV